MYLEDKEITNIKVSSNALTLDIPLKNNTVEAIHNAFNKLQPETKLDQK